MAGILPDLDRIRSDAEAGMGALWRDTLRILDRLEELEAWHAEWMADRPTS